MKDFVTVTGMVIKSVNAGEYDRNVTILTTDRGKISAFARGARKPTSPYIASTLPMCFGEFRLIRGRSSYHITETVISSFFSEISRDPELVFYGTYFLEIADYYSRENTDDRELLKLLYQSLRALLHRRFSRTFVRSVFEIKAIVVNGEFPGLPSDTAVSEGVGMALEYIRQSSIEKLYTFSLTKEGESELSTLAGRYRDAFMHRHFNSLDIINGTWL